MTRDEISNRLKSIIEDFFRSPYCGNCNGNHIPEFALTNRFVEEYDADSLDLIEIVMAVEDEFGLEIDDDAAEKLQTVGNYLDYLTPILADKGTK